MSWPLSTLKLTCVITVLFDCSEQLKLLLMNALYNLALRLLSTMRSIVVMALGNHALWLIYAICLLLVIALHHFVLPSLATIAASPYNCSMWPQVLLQTDLCNGKHLLWYLSFIPHWPTSAISPLPPSTTSLHDELICIACWRLLLVFSTPVAKSCCPFVSQADCFML